MKRVHVGIGAALVAAFLAAASGAQQQPQPRLATPAERTQFETPRPRPAPLRPVTLPATQALFDTYVREGKMPGIVGAFGVGDMPTMFVSAGHIATDPGAPAAGPDSLWRVYSMTKPITAMAAMILIEEGKLSLDEPLADVFPAFAHMRVLASPDTSLDSRPATRPITMRNLLTHTAGLGYSIVSKGPYLHEMERLGIVPAAVSVPIEKKLRPARPKSLTEFANRVATLPLVADPGTTFSYSISLDVMGAVIEKVSGMPFDRFVQTRIFNPLRMTSSYWTVPASQKARLATNYTIIGRMLAPTDPGATSVWLDPPSFPYGGAGLVMSARDYDRFLHMLQDEGTLDGVRVMKPETVRLAMSNLLPPGVTYGSVAGATGGASGAAEMGYGAGGSVYLVDKPGGASKGTYGWGGAAGTIAWVDPVRHMRGTVMVNYFPADKWPLRQEIGGTLAKDYARFRP